MFQYAICHVALLLGLADLFFLMVEWRKGKGDNKMKWLWVNILRNLEVIAILLSR